MNCFRQRCELVRYFQLRIRLHSVSQKPLLSLSTGSHNVLRVDLAEHVIPDCEVLGRSRPYHDIHVAAAGRDPQ